MKITSSSGRQTMKLGRAVSRRLRPGDIICLFGELGAGKTVFVKGIAQGFGIDEDKVVSPSFVLLRPHERARIPLYHFDLYRLMAADAAASAGFQEYLYGRGVAVIEWAERLGYLMPGECLKVRLSIKGKNSRLITFSAHGKRYRELLQQIELCYNKDIVTSLR